MNELPYNEEGSLIDEGAGSLNRTYQSFSNKGNKGSQGKLKTCVLVRRLKNYRKQQTPTGAICHQMSCSQQCGTSLAVLQRTSRTRREQRTSGGGVEKREMLPETVSGTDLF